MAGAVTSPGIDILMPYYGDVALMQESVRSVLSQTDPDWHLTVVDDGEAAGVPEWFAALGDERVSYLRNPVNLGVSGNFQKCLGLARRFPGGRGRGADGEQAGGDGRPGDPDSHSGLLSVSDS